MINLNRESSYARQIPKYRNTGLLLIDHQLVQTNPQVQEYGIADRNTGLLTGLRDYSQE